MKLIPEILAKQADFQALRRDLHSHPELGFEEYRTSDLIASKLSAWGLDVHRGLGKTGIIGILKRGNSPRSIGLRADMDALPLQEINHFPHRSQHEGKMHACGHDGHVAMLLAAAYHLSTQATYDGTIHFIFQPAEEGKGGAQAMVQDGLFDRFPCDAIYALHNWPGLGVGHFGVRQGAIMASSNEFRIEITGRGAHAALPHQGADPVYAAAQLITGLQSILTRNKSPLAPAVLSITQIHAGRASNIIPETAWFGGTVRSFDLDTLDLIERRMASIVTHTANAHDCSAQLAFHRNYPATINHPQETHFAATVMKQLVGAEHVNEHVEPTMGAEDFSYMLQQRPGCYAFIGNGDGNHRSQGHGQGPCMLHNPSYDFNDALIPIGASYWVHLVEKHLAPSL